MQEVLDRQAISDCLLRYTRGVDRVDAELIRSAFHPDALDFHSATQAGTVESFLSYWLPLQATRETAHHHVTNCSIDVDAGGDTAHAETYFFCIIKESGLSTIRMSGGRYVDRLEKRNDEWRIALRLVLSEWKADADASSMAEMSGRALGKSRRDRSDPVYQRPLTRPQVPVVGAAAAEEAQP